MSAFGQPRDIFFAVVAIAALIGAGALAYVKMVGITPSEPHGPAATALPLHLYAADSQGMTVLPMEAESVAVDPASEAGVRLWAQTVFGRLHHPTKSGLIAALPARTVLLSSDFNPPNWSLTLEMPPGLGSTEERLMVAALVRTYVESWPGAKGVRLNLVDKDRKPYNSAHYDFSEPLTPADVTDDAGGGNP